MPKIVLVTPEIVTLGMENGMLREVQLSSLNFSPQVGDPVEIFETGDRLVVSKVETVQPAGIPAGGIHINVSNDSINTAAANARGGGPMGGRRPVKKSVYCLLAIFLGIFGAHKFYAGRIGAGIVYLLFCWTLIPGIIGFFSGIFGLFRATDGYGNLLYY